MPLKRLDNAVDRSYWEPFRKAAEEWRQRKPSWARQDEGGHRSGGTDLDSDHREASTPTVRCRTVDPVE